jgi:hypothetical protein
MKMPPLFDLTSRVARQGAVKVTRNVHPNLVLDS